MNLNVKMIAECKGDFLGLFSELASRWKDQDLRGSDSEFDSLKCSKTEDSSFASTRLGLNDNISGRDDGHDGSLLDGRGFIKTWG
jgi:hypothetical protein